MAKGEKRKGFKGEDVEAYRHEADKRKNAVPVGLASYDTSKPKPKKYEYDPHLDNMKQQLLTVLHEIFNISGCDEFGDPRKPKFANAQKQDC
jgi:23S rRNA maturation-related 3'-5' exoribonuclease YhaM